MCQYSSVDGFANDWHFVHLASRAVGGAALVLTEATAVTAEGRISPQDLGIWNDDARRGPRAHRRVHPRAEGARRHPARARGTQGEHRAPWRGGRRRSAGRRRLGAASGRPSEPFAANYPMPRALDVARHSRRSSSASVPPRVRALDGRLRRRRDPRGARLSDSRVSVAAHQHAHRRIRRLVRQPHPPVPRGRRRRSRRSGRNACRCSSGFRRPTGRTGGWDIEQAVRAGAPAARRTASISSTARRGGNVPIAPIPIGPGYQVPFAERIRRDAGIADRRRRPDHDAAQADAIISDGQADVVLLAREMLRDPYWPLHAAEQLGQRGPVAAAVSARRASRHAGALSRIGHEVEGRRRSLLYGVTSSRTSRTSCFRRSV